MTDERKAYDPMADVKTEGFLDEDSAQIISQLIAWHDGRMETLRSTADTELIRLQIRDGDDLEISDPKVIEGYKLGIYVAEQLLGDFPVSLSE
ncbi:hypothetical protein [Neptuniibacter marinus]|uniref:hypothetical protein n=1 Tax=Neptuniibacter marinus TaxID=1806670 RepID=UPI003B5C264B